MKTVFNSNILSGILDSDFRDFTVMEIKGLEVEMLWDESDLYSFWDDVTEAIQNNQTLIILPGEEAPPLMFDKEEAFWLYYELDEILARLEVSSSQDINNKRLN